MLQLSAKQKQMIREIHICKAEHKELDDEYKRKLAYSNIPKIFDPMNRQVTLNYEDYLGNCKVKRAITLGNSFYLTPFINAMDEISNNEIILYRSQLENTLQNGLHALMEIQFLDSLVILRNETCNEKLPFDSYLTNIMFLMKNLTNFLDLNAPTVANEIYEKERIKATDDFCIDYHYKSPEEIENIYMNVKLKSLAIALAKQHSCLFDINSRKKVCQAECHKVNGLE